MIISNLNYLEELSEKNKVVGGETVKNTVIHTAYKTTSDGGLVAAYSQTTILLSDSPEVATSLLENIL